MSKSQSIAFFEEISKNKQLAQEVDKIVGGKNSDETKAKELISLAKEHGFNFTQKEAASAQGELKKSLSPEELLEVSGGKGSFKSSLMAMALLAGLGVVGAAMPSMEASAMDGDNHQEIQVPGGQAAEQQEGNAQPEQQQQGSRDGDVNVDADIADDVDSTYARLSDREAVAQAYREESYERWSDSSRRAFAERFRANGGVVDESVLSDYTDAIDLAEQAYREESYESLSERLADGDRALAERVRANGGVVDESVLSDYTDAVDLAAREAAAQAERQQQGARDGEVTVDADIAVTRVPDDEQNEHQIEIRDQQTVYDANLSYNYVNLYLYYFPYWRQSEIIDELTRQIQQPDTTRSFGLPDDLPGDRPDDLPENLMNQIRSSAQSVCCTGRFDTNFLTARVSLAKWLFDHGYYSNYSPGSTDTSYCLDEQARRVEGAMEYFVDRANHYNLADLAGTVAPTFARFADGYRALAERVRANGDVVDESFLSELIEFHEEYRNTGFDFDDAVNLAVREAEEQAWREAEEQARREAQREREIESLEKRLARLRAMRPAQQNDLGAPQMIQARENQRIEAGPSTHIYSFSDNELYHEGAGHATIAGTGDTTVSGPGKTFVKGCGTTFVSNAGRAVVRDAVSADIEGDGDILARGSGNITSFGSGEIRIMPSDALTYDDSAAISVSKPSEDTKLRNVTVHSGENVTVVRAKKVTVTKGCANVTAFPGTTMRTRDGTKFTLGATREETINNILDTMPEPNLSEQNTTTLTERLTAIAKEFGLSGESLFSFIRKHVLRGG